MPGTCVQTTYVFKLVCDLSIDAISNNLDRTLTLFSRSGHSLTLNISQTATDTVIVSSEWHHFQWHWVTSKPDFKVMVLLLLMFTQLTRDLFAIAKFLFFQLASKWLEWLSQTLHPFSHILKIILSFHAPIVAPSNDGFQISCIQCNGFSSPYLNRPTNTEVICCGCNQTMSLTTLTGGLWQIKETKLETKAMTTSSHCNAGRMCVRLPIITRENTPLPIHVVQKITIICVQKIGKFEVWNLILYTGAIWRRIEKFEYRCTTTYHPL